jgi:hypothetical protein
MKKFYLLLLILGSLNLNGQIIDSIKYQPEFPQPGETITFYCYVTYPNIGCSLEESDIYRQGTSIVAKAFHCGGFLTQLCPTIDTFQIELPSSYIGTYTFFYMPGFVINNFCNFPIFGNGDTIPYPYAVDYVEVPVGININTSHLNKMDEEIKLYPQPVNKQLIIEFNETINRNISLDLFSINGQKMLLAYTLLDNKRLAINTQHYPNGIYFCKIRDGNNLMTKKVIIQH